MEVSNNNGIRGAIDPCLMTSGAQSCPAEWWRGMYALDDGCEVYAVTGLAGGDLVLGAVDEDGQLIKGEALRVIGLKKFKKCPDDFELFHSWESYEARVGVTH